MKSLLLLLCACCLFSACTKTPTGYDTQTFFVADEWPVHHSKFEKLMADGWEIMHERRAFGRPSKYSPKEWGHEYGLRKPTYD